MSSARADKRKRSASAERTTVASSSAEKKKKISTNAEEKSSNQSSTNSGDLIPSTSGVGSSTLASRSGAVSSSGAKAAAKSTGVEDNTIRNNRLTKQIFEQIPFLESDPLKALEVLKKMVQESGLETLYASVNENTSRARDFSDRISELKKNVDGILRYMLSGKPSDHEKLEKYKEMKGIWAKIHGLNEAKVKITQGAYDMVDRVIRRLDKELESIVSEVGNGKTSSGEKGPRSKGANVEGPSRARMRGADFDMPVDPNEPTYCECKQISFGEMIACDNVNCPIEWFHFACVNLTSKPKGKWFCKRCVASGQNKLGKKKKSRLGIIEKYASASDKSEVEQLLTASDSD